MKGWLTRARPPAAFVRIRACWYASAAISETNFWAASDKSRFLNQGNTDVILLGKNEEEGNNLQSHVFTFETHFLQVIVCNLIWNLEIITSKFVLF